MVFRAIILDTFLHIWRLKLLIVLPLGMFLLLLAMPALIASDGTLEGKVRLFLLYSGNLQIVLVCFMLMGWTIWMENVEKKKKVHLLMGTKPVLRQKILFARIVAMASYAMFFIVLFHICIGVMTSYLIASSKKDEITKKKVWEKLFEVRTHKELKLLTDVSNQQVRIRGKEVSAYPFERGGRLSFSIPRSETLNRAQLKGVLTSITSNKTALISLSLKKDNEIFWRKIIPIESGKAFIENLPENSAEWTPCELEIRRDHSSKEPFYYLIRQPLVISTYYGQIWSNLLRSSLLFLLLCILLVSLSISISQFISFQGSLLFVAMVYMTGFFKSDIRQLIFPESVKIAGQQPMESFLPFDFVDLFYTILWQPILFIIPDFQALNATSKIVSGELVSWSDFLSACLTSLPFLCILTFYLSLFLPKRELGRSDL